MMIIADETVQQLLEFRRKRNWEQFHTPRNLASALVIEASELLECFQWAKDGELDKIVDREREHIEDEIADVAILLNYLCVEMDVDLDSAVRRKIRKNGLKYPVQLSKGNSRKYDRL